MKFLVIPTLILLCVPINQLHAQKNEPGDMGTGTFSVKEESKEDPQLGMQKEEQQKEEDENLDSFGQDKFNENVDPEMYETDKEE